MKQRTIHDIRALKGKAQPFLALTAYTAPIAQLADNVADVVLVGDSLGMVLYGMPNTLGVSLELMMTHARCVAQHTKQALCVIDMPFGTYQASPAQAFENCARALKETGVAAVKIEGGAEMAETIAFLTKRGIPVLAHIGLQPQQVNMMGGYRVQGKTSEQSADLENDIRAVEKAGAFAVVLEGVVEDVAAKLTRLVSIPTIGIGASPACDGQILVTEDALGFTAPPRAKFVKPYADFYAEAGVALKALQEDVKNRRFPAAEYCYQKAS